MAKQLLYTDEARQKILVGVNKLARVVKATMGPGGRWVAYDKSYGGPGVINDGVTVAKEVELEDPFENMGAQMVREVASKTSDIAGDGTTTATILAQAIFREGVILSTGTKRNLLRYRVEPTTRGGRTLGRGKRVRGTSEAIGLWLAGRRGLDAELDFT